MAFTIIDASGPIISAPINGELTKHRCRARLAMVAGVGGQLFPAVMVACLVSLSEQSGREHKIVGSDHGNDSMEWQAS